MAATEVLRQSHQPRTGSRLDAHDASVLTSFNPFGEEDEREQSSYALVSSLFSKVRQSLTAASSSTAAPAPAPVAQPAQNVAQPSAAAALTTHGSGTTVRTLTSVSSSSTMGSQASQAANAALVFRSKAPLDRPRALLKASTVKPAGIAPPLVSRTPALSEPTTSFVNPDNDSASIRSGAYFGGSSTSGDSPADPYISIPGFPSIQDSDTRSVHTVASTSFNTLNTIATRNQSVSKVIRRIRGEGLSRDYWMNDEKVRECSDCSGVFTTWRRKHHCRICGQIFCGRCASNIIKGSRFGADSMIRVCNGCMQRIRDAEKDEDDDDRRSIISSYSYSAPSPFTAHQLGMHSQPSPDFQSHYSSNPLFASSSEPFSFFSPPEGQRSLSEDGEDSTLPEDWDGRGATAPFRRNITDEDKVEAMTTSSKNVDVDPGLQDVSVSLNGAALDPDQSDPALQSSIQFPGATGETEVITPSPRPSRVNSSVEPDLLREVLRTRTQSYIGTNLGGDTGWRGRRESTFKEQEQEKLNSQAVFHFRLLLGQMLISNQIPEARQWQETLTRLVEKVAGEITFLGQDMDLRRFVKIKKLPGGAPRDSEFVPGAVITKNFAHRQMPRAVENPRIVLWSIDDRKDGEFVLLDHARQTVPQRWQKTAERIMRLQPTVVLASTPMEGAIIDKLFAEKQICVAKNIDQTAMQFISRSTNATVINGYDKLAVVGEHGPRPGSCQRVAVQTYDHPLIPGRRKTLMRFENVPREQGRDPMQEVCCTIILRGGSVDTLRRVKAVTRLLVFLVRNLSAESCLWGNMSLTSPTVAYGDAATLLVAAPVPLAPPKLRAISTPSLSLVASGSKTPTVASPTLFRSAWVGPIMENILDETNEGPLTPLDDDGLNEEDRARLYLSREILESYEDYTRTFISVSSTLRFAPPYPITRMKEVDEKLHRARQAWEDEVVRREEKVHQLQKSSASIMSPSVTSPLSSTESSIVFGHSQEATITPSSFASTYSDSTLNNTTSIVSTAPTLLSSPNGLSSPTPRAPMSPEEPPSYFERNLFSQPSLSSLRSTKPSIQSSMVTGSTNMLSECHPLRQVSEIALESAFSAAVVEHDQARRVWEWYVRKNKDDFVLEKYQTLAVRRCTVPLSEDVNQQRPCFPPSLHYFNYYGKNDLTLGQYFLTRAIEFLKLAAMGRTCEGKDCNVPYENHCQLFFHNETRLRVMTEKFEPLKPHHSHLLDPKDNLPMMDALVLAKDQPPWKVMTCSYCRECKVVTPFEEVRDLATYYSFAKFLELFFYPADAVHIHESNCEHNVWQSHTRYFMISRVLFSFTASPITVHEVVFPPVKMRVEPEHQLETRNSDYQHLVTRVATFYRHLSNDLNSIARDNRTGDEKIDSQLNNIVSELVERMENERSDIMRQIHYFYDTTPATDTLCFAWPRMFLQERIVEWQTELNRLPKPRPMQVSEKRLSTFSATVKLPWVRRNEPSILDRSHVMSSSLSEAEEYPTHRNATNSSLTSTSESESVKEKEGINSDAESTNETHEKVPIVEAPLPTGMSPLTLDIPAVSADAPAVPPAVDPEPLPSMLSDGDSDSTIGAKRPLKQPTIVQTYPTPPLSGGPRSTNSGRDSEASSIELRSRSSSRARSRARSHSRSRKGRALNGETSVLRASRLPKRAGNGLTVAELVRQYQNIHPGSYKDVSRASMLVPTASAYETDQDMEYGPRLTHKKIKGKGAHKRSSSVDFENGYAANIGTRYLAKERRGTSPVQVIVPAPRRMTRPTALSSSESRGPSRRTSPDKRAALGRTNIPAPILRPDSAISPPLVSPGPSSPSRAAMLQAPTKSSKGKQKAVVPKAATMKGPSTLRRPPGSGAHSRVSNLTRQFERISKDSERANRRYAVIRGKKARPVATARAKVEVFNNIEDAIADMTDDSDSSEADDEDEGAAPERPTPPNDLPGDEQNQSLLATTTLKPSEPTPSLDAIVTPTVETSSDVVEDSERSPTSQSLPKEQVSLALDLSAVSPAVPHFFSDGRSFADPQSDVESLFGTDRHAFMRALSGLWTQPIVGTPSSGRRSRVELEAEDQLVDPVHIFKDANIVVRTDEPTSIIAFTLSSNQYVDGLSTALKAAEIAEQPPAHNQEPSEPFMPDDSSNTGDTSTYSVIGQSEIKEAVVKEHPKVTPSFTFESENITISCTPFFMEQFDALRKLCGCDKSLIESLARCVKWDASGGKSGSAFLKTRDDRFIAKELSRSEVEAIATFAPAYFEYMTSAITSGRPTLLAKIFGVFRITIRMLISPSGGRPVLKTKRLQLCIMENLFYSRKFTTIYDLKGSNRNRLVQTTGRENEVLLDENLAQTAHLNPLFVREHSKRILRSAIYNDTKFLAEMNVMDYSLVVGVDPIGKELVVGIVDYVRTYTWDKKLENLIKDPLLIGGLAGKNEPTIVTPKLYKARFRAAMERYFGLVPDRWMKEHDDPEPA
ncbi:hypothetical protein BKA62DRAFT_765689 [Auriculariales sp. MPI-PUGE-AT-0066]|nr:hypothetical protein BKA62DRAFT_765689 [Auriculariales sp. MPI-PUGE-AT-0066]